MEEMLYYSSLYDIYKELLTEKQRHYFEDYYFENFSLSEIAENDQVSRNAIHQQLKLIQKKLLFFEEKLSILAKREKLLALFAGNEQLQLQIQDIW